MQIQFNLCITTAKDFVQMGVRILLKFDCNNEAFYISRRDNTSIHIFFHEPLHELLQHHPAVMS